MNASWGVRRFFHRERPQEARWAALSLVMGIIVSYLNSVKPLAGILQVMSPVPFPPGRFKKILPVNKYPVIGSVFDCGFADNQFCFQFNLYAFGRGFFPVFNLGQYEFRGVLSH